MKITKEELTNIIKEEIETSMQEKKHEKDAQRFRKFSTEDYEQWADENNMPLMAVEVGGEIIFAPITKPKLPKNWGRLPGRGKHPLRYWFRMWNKYSRGIDPQDKKDALDALKTDTSNSKTKGQLPRGDFELPPAKKLPSEKDALKALGQFPSKKGKGKKIPDIKAPAYDPSKDPDGLGGKKKGIDNFRFRDRSKPFKLKKEPRGRLKVPKMPKLKGKPILINKRGRRTSLRTKDSRWKFRDGKTLPLYNYIPGRGQVDDEVGKAYYRFSLGENHNITMDDILEIVEQEVEKALSEIDISDEDRIAKELSKAEAMMKAANEQMQNPEKRASLLKISLELYQRACNLGSIKGCQAIPKVKKMIEKLS